jgi:hypothetical protein
MEKKLTTKLRFTFDIDEEIPVVEITPLDEKDSKKKEIIILKPKQNGRDSSSNSSPRLF